MKDKLISFSVLRYKPSRLAGETMNLGVLLYDEQTGKADFKYIMKYSRLGHFDDEVDVKNVEKLLVSIRDEVLFQVEKEVFDLNKFIEFYINSYVFDLPQKVVYEDYESTAKMIEGIYLRFDKDKKSRLGVIEERKFVTDILKTKDYMVRRNVNIQGICDEKIQYDFETEKTYIKIFNFDERDLSRSINIAKTWAWNGMQSQKKLVILYRYDKRNTVINEKFNMIMRIFEASGVETCDIANVDRFLELIA